MIDDATRERSVESLRDALEALGVTDTTLTAAEATALATDGFVVLENVIDPNWLSALCEAYERLMTEKYGSWDSARAGITRSDYWHHESGARKLTDLVSEGTVFDGVYIHPRLLAAAVFVLGDDFQFSGLNARDPLPGYGHQELHLDGPPLNTAQRAEMMTSTWLLDDFTAENGATRVVPGSHRIGGAISEHVADPTAAHPDQRIVTAPAGSVIIFNACVWHSGTENRTPSPRRVLHCAFATRNHAQRNCQKERIRKSTYERISPAARYLLGV